MSHIDRAPSRRGRKSGDRLAELRAPRHVSLTWPYNGLHWLIIRHGRSETNDALEQATRQALNSGAPVDAIDKSFYRRKPDREVGLTPAAVPQLEAAGKLTLQWGLDTGLKIPADKTGPKTGPALLWVVSPFARTVQSYGIIAPSLARFGSILRLDERMTEKRFGKWDGLSDIERREMYPAYFARYRKQGSFLAGPPEGEAGKDISRRVRAGLKDAAATARRMGITHIVLVVHRPVLEAAAVALAGDAPSAVARFPGNLGNCAMVMAYNGRVNILDEGYRSGTEAHPAAISAERALRMAGSAAHNPAETTLLQGILRGALPRRRHGGAAPVLAGK